MGSSVAAMGMVSESKFHVLAVDDSLIDRKLIERLLKTSSYQVTTVDSGSKALEVLGFQDDLSSSIPSVSPNFVRHHDQQHRHHQEVDVNLVITDYCMPGMTGYDLLKKIKGSKALRNIPVVIMSSENVPSRIDRCLEEGAEEFFLKPVRLADVNRLKPHLLKTKLSSDKPMKTELENHLVNSETQSLHGHHHIPRLLPPQPPRELELPLPLEQEQLQLHPLQEREHHPLLSLQSTVLPREQKQEREQKQLLPLQSMVLPQDQEQQQLLSLQSTVLPRDQEQEREQKQLLPLQSMVLPRDQERQQLLSLQSTVLPRDQERQQKQLLPLQSMVLPLPLPREQERERQQFPPVPQTTSPRWEQEKLQLLPSRAPGVEQEKLQLLSQLQTPHQEINNNKRKGMEDEISSTAAAAADRTRPRYNGITTMV